MPQPPPLPTARSARTRPACWLVSLGIAVVALGLVAGVVWAVNRWSEAAHASAPMREAMRRSSCSVELVAVLGEPLRADRVPYGQIHQRDDGHSLIDLRVGLHGPQASGTLHVRGHRHDGRWDYPVMYVLLPDERPHDLTELDDAEAAQRCALQTCREEGRCPAPPNGLAA